MIDEKGPADRPRDYIREHSPGCCKILSLGDECLCPLCDLDRVLNQKCVHVGPFQRHEIEVIDQ